MPVSRRKSWFAMWGRTQDSKIGMDEKRVSQNPEKGQTLVEFALVALLFLTLVLGIVEFGRALWTWNTIVQATRAGARFAVVEPPTSDDAPIKKFVVYHDPLASISSTP